MLSLTVLSVVLLFMVTFALQNPQAVTMRLLFWQLESSLASVVLAATVAGIPVAKLFEFTKRLLRWKRGTP
jgi:uncharacterized integral membrane protein